MGFRKSIFALGLLVAILAPIPGEASYYYPRYNNYGSSGYGYTGGYGSSNSQPVISLDMNPKDQINSAFRIAAREGRISDMLELVREGADINSVSDEGDTALMYAARNCSVEVTTELLRLRVNVNIRNRDGDTALIDASMESCLPVVKLLLHNPRLLLSPRDRQGKSALDYAHDGAVIEVDGPEAQIFELLESRLSHRWSPKSSIKSARQRGKRWGK